MDMIDTEVVGKVKQRRGGETPGGQPPLKQNWDEGGGEGDPLEIALG